MECLVRQDGLGKITPKGPLEQLRRPIGAVNYAQRGQAGANEAWEHFQEIYWEEAAQAQRGEAGQVANAREIDFCKATVISILV